MSKPEKICGDCTSFTPSCLCPASGSRWAGPCRADDKACEHHRDARNPVERCCRTCGHMTCKGGHWHCAAPAETWGRRSHAGCAVWISADAGAVDCPFVRGLGGQIIYVPKATPARRKDQG